MVEVYLLKSVSFVLFLPLIILISYGFKKQKQQQKTSVVNSFS